jgi:GT2 family glycosyltransferase
MIYNQLHFDLAILITCHNRIDKTTECLKRLFNQKKGSITYSFDVYLVDDGSSDGTSETINRKYPEVNIIRGNGNLFWNRGMHLAWRMSQVKHYAYYLWLNDDTLLFEDGILEMLTTASTNDSLTIICGATCSSITEEYTYGLTLVSGRPVLPNTDFNQGSLMNGNCVLVSQAIFKLIGNLDPIFPHAIGDYDYGLRLISLGGKIITTTKFIAYCEKNEKLPLWCYSDTPLKSRIKSLYSPLGNSHPKYFFIYELRHFGIFTATKHFLSIHLRLLFPSLWK